MESQNTRWRPRGSEFGNSIRTIEVEIFKKTGVSKSTKDVKVSLAFECNFKVKSLLSVHEFRDCRWQFLFDVFRVCVFESVFTVLSCCTKPYSSRNPLFQKCFMMADLIQMITAWNETHKLLYFEMKKQNRRQAHRKLVWNCSLALGHTTLLSESFESLSSFSLSLSQSLPKWTCKLQTFSVSCLIPVFRISHQEPNDYDDYNESSSHWKEQGERDQRPNTESLQFDWILDEMTRRWWLLSHKEEEIRLLLWWMLEKCLPLLLIFSLVILSVFRYQTKEKGESITI